MTATDKQADYLTQFAYVHIHRECRVIYLVLIHHLTDRLHTRGVAHMLQMHCTVQYTGDCYMYISDALNLRCSHTNVTHRYLKVVSM